MNKDEVEQILIIAKSGDEEALSMKVYKDGTVTRRGCGGLPEIGIAAMSFTESPTLFNKLMELVPQQILDNPISYQDEKINTPLEYIIAFYGVSSNGETGEHANWTKSTGIRLLIDTNTSFRHAILGFADKFSLDAAEQTNPWYFDTIANAVFKLKATTLPETMIAVPQTESDLRISFENYVNQIKHSARGWDLSTFANGKTYLDSNNRRFQANITSVGDSYKVKFLPVGEQPSKDNSEGKPKGKWWKFW